jgi:hypothetical protein
MGINFEENTNEYELETSLILPRLRTCSSAADITRLLHQTFMECFSPAGALTERHYANIGAEIWELWVTFQGSTQL